MYQEESGVAFTNSILDTWRWGWCGDTSARSIILAKYLSSHEISPLGVLCIQKEYRRRGCGWDYGCPVKFDNLFPSVTKVFPIVPRNSMRSQRELTRPVNIGECWGREEGQRASAYLIHRQRPQSPGQEVGTVTSTPTSRLQCRIIVARSSWTTIRLNGRLYQKYQWLKPQSLYVINNLTAKLLFGRNMFY